jgi:hypothetical protein
MLKDKIGKKKKATRINQNTRPGSQDRDNLMKRKSIIKQSIKKEHKKRPESIHQTRDPGHQTKIIS